MSTNYQSMSAKMIAALKLLLFFAILTLIVCQTSETSLTRHDRTTFQEIGEPTSENVNNFKESKSIDNRSRSSQKTSAQSAIEEKIIDRDKIINEIFILSTNASGLQLFNNTFPAAGGYQSSPKPLTSSTQGYLFGVRRTTEGKLEPVFERNPFLTTLQNPIINKTNNHVITFPGAKGPKTNNTFNDATRDCIDRDNIRKGYCQNVTNYPDLSRYEDYLKEKFGAFFVKEESLPQDISERMNAGPNEEFLCASKRHTIHPQTLQNSKSDWRIVVQLNKNMSQELTYDECIFYDGYANPPCNNLDALPVNKTSYCKQTKGWKSFLVYNGNGTFTTESLAVSACCKCVIVTNG